MCRRRLGRGVNVTVFTAARSRVMPDLVGIRYFVKIFHSRLREITLCMPVSWREAVAEFGSQAG